MDAGTSIPSDSPATPVDAQPPALTPLRELRQRLDEMTAVYNLTTMLAEARDLGQVLQRTAEAVAELMQVKATSIRLLDRQTGELVIKAVHNLSRQYLDKGPVHLARAPVDRQALSTRGWDYVEDMGSDARVIYPQEAQREGIVSMLSVGMRYKGKPVGVLRLYTAQRQAFAPRHVEMMKAVATQAAAAIENARLQEESRAAEALEKQVRMAADVQQRMIPATAPPLPGVDLASVYVPCHELGGDLYDFIPLPDDNLGLVIADVSGKGVPASLTMAAVRAFLRAQVDNVYYLYEVVRRINLMLCRDTRPGEFVTLFYGVLDARNRRLTYCSAGHSPALLLRGGQARELEGQNMTLGIDPEQQYRQSVMPLHRGDVLLLYTDGLVDAMNARSETFGRRRAVEALRRLGSIPDAAAETVAQGMLWEMRRFAGLTKQTDDVTMVVARQI